MLGSSYSAATTAALPVLVGLLVGFMGYLPQPAEGHVYLMEPVSRNFWATSAFQDMSYPDINWCPHCFQSRGPAAIRARAEELTDPAELEVYGGGAWPHFGAYERNELASNGNYYEPDSIAVRHGICGDPEQTAQEGSNLYGQDNVNYPVLDTYAEGSVMEIKVAISTNHWGHLEFFICNADDMTDPEGVVTQGCFNMHPLDRASDDDSASRIDPNHVGRYFLDPSCRASETDQSMPEGAFTGDVATARYQLPDGLTCTRCILQMVYYTGNSCKHPGYDDFNPSSWDSECAPNTADWINVGVAMCGDGDAYPEEFWNCADIEITPGGDSTPTAPSPSTSSSEDPEPTPSPDSDSEDSDDAPAAEPTPAPETEEPTMYESYTPMPVENDDLVGERSSSVPSPGSDGDCDDPVAAYEQCGGDDYDGSTCCSSGYECAAVADCYSQCRPIEDTDDIEEDDCAEEWEQCGGSDWDGPTCCMDDIECFETTESFFQCIP